MWFKVSIKYGSGFQSCVVSSPNCVRFPVQGSKFKMHAVPSPDTVWLQIQIPCRSGSELYEVVNFKCCVVPGPDGTVCHVRSEFYVIPYSYFMYFQFQIVNCSSFT